VPPRPCVYLAGDLRAEVAFLEARRIGESVHEDSGGLHLRGLIVAGHRGLERLFRLSN
jgi:hypothetical protein